MTVGLIWLFSELMLYHLVEQNTRSNAALAELFARRMLVEHDEYLLDAVGRSGDQLRADPRLKRLDRMVRGEMHGLPVVKVKLYATDGVTAYSTDPAQIGERKGKNDGVLRALAGVLLAAVLPSLLGLPGALALFAGFLLLAWWTWRRSVPPQSLPNGGGHTGLMQPLRDGRFVRLLGVFMLNGIASAVPATLVLFFVQDRLQAPTQMEPAFLGVYFLSAAVSIPLWLALVRRLGLARSWLLGMVLAVLVFIWAGVLSAGDAWLFLGVCALSGLALGADLALPSAMLAGLLQLRPGGPAMAGAYFGWWNFAAKLNLALAAGLALPLLEGFGYQPGARDPQALQALTLAYCILPCVLKVLACWGLYVGIIRAEPRPVQEVSS